MPENIEPKNISAQINPKVKGNPVSTRLETTVSNFYPGLEMDMRNIWRKIFKNLTMHEALNRVLDSEIAEYNELVGMTITRLTIGEGDDKLIIPLETKRINNDNSFSTRTGMEWVNSLTEIIPFTGKKVIGSFRETLEYQLIEWSETIPVSDERAGFGTDQSYNTPFYMAGNNLSTQYCIFDLGAIVNLEQIRMASAPTGGGENGDLSRAFPKNFSIQISDNRSNWNNVPNSVNELNYNVVPNQWNLFDFPNRKGRYVRLSIRNQPEYLNPAGRSYGNLSLFMEMSFIGIDGSEIINTIDKELEVNTFFLSQNNENTKVIARELAEPGELTQSLCSPWQSDYRECGCYYWAASRPDYIAVKDENDVVVNQINWLQKDRSETATYAPDNVDDVDNQYSREDLYRGWEKNLRFVINGQDEK